VSGQLPILLRPLSGHSDTLNLRSECQPWRGALDKDGYPKGRQHRRLYEARRGPIPLGLDLDHACGNRACVNLDHLEPITRAENCRRRAQTKLTVEQVARIKLDPRFQRQIAAEYGITASMVSQIKNGRWWRDVEPCRV
jgi:hypothetical protein